MKNIVSTESITGVEIIEEDDYYGQVIKHIILF